MRCYGVSIYIYYHKIFYKMINHEVKNTNEKQKLYLRIDIHADVKPCFIYCRPTSRIILRIIWSSISRFYKIYAKKKRFIQNCVQVFPVSYGNWKTFNNTADIAKQVFKKKTGTGEQFTIN